jgi:hypothetical protein
MDQWLKRDGLSKELSSASVSTYVTDVNESRCLMRPSIGIPRTTGTANNGSSDFCVSLWFTYAGLEITLEVVRVCCNEFLPNISVLPARLRMHRDTDHRE